MGNDFKPTMLVKPKFKKLEPTKNLRRGTLQTFPVFEKSAYEKIMLNNSIFLHGLSFLGLFLF